MDTSISDPRQDPPEHYPDAGEIQGSLPATPEVLPPVAADDDDGEGVAHGERDQIADEYADVGDATPQAHTELFIGLVAPIGTDLDAVVRELERLLARFSYGATHVRLSEFLSHLSWPEPRDFSGLPYDERTWQAMDAGNDLRELWTHASGERHYDALALLGIAQVETYRANRAIADGVSVDLRSGAPTLDRQAWVLRSLKTPDEVRTLRDIYGPRFFLIGAHCAEPRRVENLRAKIAPTRRGQPESDWRYAPSQLIDRDWKEEHEGGQDVRGTFHQADFFIDASEPETITGDLSRVLDILFASPYETPTIDEYAMFIAAGSARRSAELGRQVGAAIATEDGSVLALGTNEVPSSGGGPYRRDHSPDRREFRLSRDTNRLRQEEIARSIEDLIAERFDSAAHQAGLPDDVETMAQLRQRLLDELPSAVLKTTEVGDLTEFGRATHAEMSAMLDAARRGVAIKESWLFTTTFPCHNCARHVVEAGITRLVFIEPYAKSRALELHRDSIALAGDPNVAGKVLFEPFVGVAPRRFLQLFDAGWREQRDYPKRKDPDGWTTDFDAKRPNALPVFSDLERDDIRPLRPVYRLRERRAVALLQDLFDRSDLRMKETE